MELQEDVDVQESLQSEVSRLEGRLTNAKEMLRSHNAIQNSSKLPALPAATLQHGKDQTSKSFNLHAPRPPEAQRPGTSNGRTVQQQQQFRPATADTAAGVGVFPVPRREATPRAGPAQGLVLDLPWSQPLKMSVLDPENPVGPPTSRLMLNRDVKKHRVKWENLHQCQKLFHLADELWRLGDEQRRTIDTEIPGGTAATDARLRLVREQLVQMAQEIQSLPSRAGTANTGTAVDVSYAALVEEKARYRRRLADSEEKISSLEIALSAYLGGENKEKGRTIDSKRYALRCRLETHYCIGVSPAFAAWRRTVALSSHEYELQSVSNRVFSVLDRTLERVHSENELALLTSTWQVWMEFMYISRLESAERWRQTCIQNARSKTLRVATKGFGDRNLALQSAVIRCWQSVAKNTLFNERRRKGIVNQMCRLVDAQGWLFLQQCVVSWGDLIKTNRSKRKAKEKLLKTILEKLSASDRKIVAEKFVAWARHVQAQATERALSEATEATIRARMQKMQAFEKMLASEGPRLVAACNKAWVDFVEICRTQKRMKQNGMDTTLRRAMGLQQELVSMCVRAWSDDCRAEQQKYRQERAAEARRKALAQFEKSLGANQMGLLQTIIRPWREQVDLRVTRQNRRKAMLERAARTMAQSEQLVGLLFPLWVKETRESTFLREGNVRAKRYLERGKDIILKLRDRSILQIFWLGWFLRACSYQTAVQ